MKPKRPQDKWNEKNGYVSKSYKLHKKTIELFANACNAKEITQAGQLTKLMIGFLDSENRRNSIMYIKEKPYADTKERDYYDMLEKNIQKALGETTDTEIENRIEAKIVFLKEKPLFITIDNALEYYKEFKDTRDITDFTTFDTAEMIFYIKDKYIEQAALAGLLNQGILMPVASIPQRNHIEINLKHRQGNKVFDIYLDVLPYTRFALIKKI